MSYQLESQGVDSTQVLLNLANNQITWKGMINFPKTQWANLITLDLTSNKIGDKGCKYISQKVLDRMHILRLGKFHPIKDGNNLTSVGVFHLSKAHFQNLFQISLMCNFLSGNSINWLFKSYWPKIQDMIKRQQGSQFLKADNQNVFHYMAIMSIKFILRNLVNYQWQNQEKSNALFDCLQIQWKQLFHFKSYISYVFTTPIQFILLSVIIINQKVYSTIRKECALNYQFFKGLSMEIRSLQLSQLLRFKAKQVITLQLDEHQALRLQALQVPYQYNPMMSSQRATVNSQEFTYYVENLIHKSFTFPSLFSEQALQDQISVISIDILTQYCRPNTFLMEIQPTKFFIRQLKLSLLMNKVTFLEKYMKVVFEEHQFRAIYLQQKSNVKEAQNLRRNHNLNKLIYKNSKKIKDNIQGMVNQEQINILKMSSQNKLNQKKKYTKIEHKVKFINVNYRQDIIQAQLVIKTILQPDQIVANFIIKQHNIQQSSNNNKSSRMEGQINLRREARWRLWINLT